MALDDIDEAVYPATINEDLVDYGHVPDNVDDAGGADAAAFLGLGNVTEAVAAPVPPVSESQSCGSKRRSPVWDNFDEILDDKRVRIAAVCKFCRHRLSAKSAAGTGHLLRHQNACKNKADHAKMVQTRLGMNPDGSYRNWEYKPEVARVELCKLIARLDLPLSVADNDAWDDYIQCAHNPRHVRVSRFSTSRDLEKLFIDTINNLKHIVFPGVNSICLTSDIWSGNAKEDYITVSTTSSESCFNQSGRILEDRRRRLNPETVEQLIIIKDWELAARRAQHSVEDLELEEKFKNLWLDEDNAGAAAGDES